MTLIACIDIRLGLSFLGKRQSRDRVVYADIVRLLGKKRLFIGEYSRALFEDAKISLAENSIYVTKNPLANLNCEDAVFLEACVDNEAVLSADRLILYCWNRHYPSDRRLEKSLIEDNFVLENCFDFAGNSHEKLTRYTLKRKI